MDENTQAILLLASRFNKGVKGDPEPLTPTEYGRFAVWLKGEGRQPSDLLRHFDEVVSAWSDPKGKITAERLKALLGRGMAMGIALEKWSSAGIWILTRAQAAYPDRLRRRLGSECPAVLLGVGDSKLLNAGGVAIVGSRNIQPEEQEFAEQVGRAGAMEGFNVVSGGARGVDEIAMRAALDADGTAVGVLASDLLKAALSPNWRKPLKSGQLCLVTPYYPEAPFQVGNAMGRNKYVYCLSEYGVIVRSDKGRGGTWAGAQENLKRGWVPLFTRAESRVDGNVALMAQGAVELRLPGDVSDPTEEWLRSQLEAGVAAAEDSPEAEQESDLYARVLRHAEEALKERTRVTLGELKKAFPEARQKELTDCLDRAVEEGVLERHGRDRTYKKFGTHSQQQGLFDI